MLTNKTETLAEMRAGFAEANAVLARIPSDRLTEVGVTDEWSVRDLLAHEAGYERWVAAAVFGDLEGRTPSNQEFFGRDDAPSEADDANDDTTNAWVVAHARTLPLEQVLAEREWAHDRLIAAVEACSEEQLTEVGLLPSMKQKPLLEVLPDQCWGHHRQHAAQLRAFADRLAAD
jgi:hypothetical protein